MAPFQSKIGWKRPRKTENKNHRSVSFLPGAKYQIKKKQPKNSKTTAKKLKKLKNTITGSFEAKIGRRRPRKTENKNYRSVPFLPDAKQNFPKEQQKNSEN